jgi:hypothetical protein
MLEGVHPLLVTLPTEGLLPLRAATATIGAIVGFTFFFLYLRFLRLPQRDPRIF